MATALLLRHMRRRDLHSSSLAAYRSVFPLRYDNQTQIGVKMLRSAHQMVREAHAHAKKDKERKQLIDPRNSVDTTMHGTEKSLGEYRRQFTFSKGKSAGRNSSGRITIFHRGGGSKRLHRKIDLKRSTSSMGIVEKIDYDPNRSSRVALVRWTEGVNLGHQRKCNTIEDFVPPQEILKPTLTTISSLFSLSSLQDQRKVARLSPGLTTANVVIGPVNSEGGGAGSKKTCANDVFFSALSSPKAKGKIAPPSFGRSFGFPRIAVAGAKPAFFAPRRKENVGGKNTFSLSEIQKLDTNSIIWEHRIKRKAAVSWQSFRQQETLGLCWSS